jgi:hypothetical protein
MTIALAFRCADGAVLATDSQMTVSQLAKFPAKKIYTFGGTPASPAFAFAGREDFSRISISKLAEVIKRAETHGEGLLDALETEAKRIHEEFHSAYDDPAERLELGLFVALNNKGTTALLSIFGPVVCPIADYDFMGVGAPIARAVATPLYYPAITTVEACRLAIYTLMQTKEFSDACGGPSQIAVICANNPFISTMLLNEDQTEQVEKVFLLFQEHLRPVLLSFYDVDEEAVFKDKLKEFSKMARKERRRLAKQFT